MRPPPRIQEDILPSPRTPRPHAPFAACFAVMAVFCLMAHVAFAAAAVSVDQGGDYAGRVLDKIIEIWTPPQGLKSNVRARLSVSVDASGQVTACKILASSGVAAFDASTCDAARQAGAFGTPPYGAPMDIHLTFWNGTPKGKSMPTGRETPPKPETLASVSAPTGASTPAGVSTPSVPAAGKNAAHAAIPLATGAPSREGLPTYGEPGGQPAPAQTSATAHAAASPPPASGAAANDTATDKKYAKYRQTVTRQLRAATIIPAATAPGTYQTRIALTISPQGEVTGFTVLAPTGDKLLDKYVQRGIRRAGSLPHPPAGLKGRLDITLTLVRR